MKKVYAILVMLVCVVFCSSFATAESSLTGKYDKEILFQGIPWETDMNTVQKMLSDMGFPVELYANAMQPVVAWDKTGDGYSRTNSGGRAIAWDSDFKFPKIIGGYPIWLCETYGIFDFDAGYIDTNMDNSHFISATVGFDTKNPEYIYPDLQHKMISVYGEPAESFVDEHISFYWGTYSGDTYASYSVWYGLNNTAVSLVYKYSIDDGATERKDESVRLYYGKTDGEERLKHLERVRKDLEKQAELEKLQQNQNDDVSGL